LGKKISGPRSAVADVTGGVSGGGRGKT